MSSSTRVMKSNTISEALAGGQYNFEDLQVRCENYLESVRQQSRQMLLDAQEEIERLKQEAKTEGHQLGLHQGLQEAEKTSEEKVKQEAKSQVDKKLQAVLPGLQQAANQIHELRQDAEAYWQQQSIELVLAITRKLIHRSIANDPTIVAGRIKDVLKLVMGQSEIQLHVSEQDLEQLSDQLEQVTSRIHQTKVQLIGQPELASGECVVQMKYGEIDACIETQLQRIAEELLGEAT
ncbi:FliH/SctL family protein [uncultured Rubinisphaera sp.]|uniref:FliH/SctL family protein n=1 Tax=uncultured Rubinisphaera sp. TaxID=1678686 RepID=UPI0030D88724